MSQLVNNIAHFLSVDTGYEDADTNTKAEFLESTLTEICFRLAEAEALTGGNKLDIGYLLSIVSSYLMGIQEGTLDPKTVEPPSLLFIESLFPSLENPQTIDTEVIEYDDNDDSGAVEGHVTEDTPDLRA